MKHTRRNIYLKLIIIEIVGICLMSQLVPILANYPPFSEDQPFHHQVEVMSHTMQYFALGSLAVILYVIVINLFLKDVFKYLKNRHKRKPTFEELENIRMKCFKFPRKIMQVQMIVVIVVLGLLFVSLDMDLRLIFKFLLIYFSFFSAIALITGMFIKSDLDNIVKTTYETSSEYAEIKHPTKFSNELLYNLVPFFIVVTATISLLGYAKTSNTIGEENYYYYKLYIDKIHTSKVDVDYLENALSDLPKKNSNDYYFIVTPTDTILSNPKGKLSDFFLKYADTYLVQTNGRVYEYYGIEEEAYVKRVVFNDGSSGYIGMKYSTTSSELSKYFITAAILFTLAYIVILIKWSNTVGNNIAEVADNLSSIAKKKNISNIKNLPITSTNEIGKLTIAFNDIQQTTKQNIKTIKNNQNQLVEQERLASLGQLVGGIAHNLKTPIMSISGAVEGLSDLVKEYDASIDDPEVNSKDHHDIAKDMTTWIAKIKTHAEYMSDVITAVKGQAVALSNDVDISFTVEEMLKRVNILMKHELKNAIVYLNISLKTDKNSIIHGDVNSLVQVINNMISNSIQAYAGKKGQNIDLIVERDGDNLLISVKDYACGIPKSVKDNLFKKMVTTKGKNGTGLGLYMSYSTIRGHFNGNITVDSEEGKGSTFTITLPLN